MKLNKLIAVSFMVLITLIGGTLVFDILNNHKIAKIRAEQDNSFAEYAYNKQIATSALDVLTLHDEQSYQKVKNAISFTFCDALKDTYFSHENYTGLSMSPPIVVITSVIGDMTKESSGIYIFKVDLTLSYEDSSTILDATMLISVSNGVVYKIERI